LRETIAARRKDDVALLAVDPHEPWAAKFLLKETGLSTDAVSFPLLTDPSLTVSAAYGVASQMRIHVELSNRPATFIIDKEGILRVAKLGRRFNDRPKPEEIDAELEMLDGPR
jgi:peroxiredoxin